MNFSVLAVSMDVDPTVLDPGATAWMLAASALVLLMTPGLAFFYGGLVRMKSVLNIMMMSFGAMGVVAVVWALWGYGMAFGPDTLNGFIGDPFANFGLSGLTSSIGSKAAGLPDMVFIGFQATFAIITVALISGAVAERVRFGPWLLFAALWVTLVYAPIAHWVWGGGLFGPTGIIGSKISALDFAGGTVVHMNAGMAGLMLAVVLGKRLGFMKDPNIRPHNLPFVMLGAGPAVVRLVRVQRRLRARGRRHGRPGLDQHAAGHQRRAARLAARGAAPRRARHFPGRCLGCRGGAGRRHPCVRLRRPRRRHRDRRHCGRGLCAGRRAEVQDRPG